MSDMVSISRFLGQFPPWPRVLGILFPLPARLAGSPADATRTKHLLGDASLCITRCAVLKPPLGLVQIPAQFHSGLTPPPPMATPKMALVGGAPKLRFLGLFLFLAFLSLLLWFETAVFEFTRTKRA